MTDDLEAPEEGSTSAHSEVVVDQPEMFVSCADCWDGHIVGDPVTIQTSYHGYCESLPFGWEYPCRAQPYALTVECIGGPCTQTPAGGSADGWMRYTQVTPLSTDPLTIRLRMNDRTFTFNPFVSFVPDELRVGCRRHQAPGTPACSEEENDPPLELELALYAGTRRLVPTQQFTVASDRPGTPSGDRLQRWYLSAPGVHTVHASYGALAVDYTVTVTTPPPPPPPPTFELATERARAL